MQKSKILLKNCKKIPYLQSFVRHHSDQFVPKHEAANPKDVEKLVKFLTDKHHVLVLTGAGISTESGKFHTTQ